MTAASSRRSTSPPATSPTAIDAAAILAAAAVVAAVIPSLTLIFAGSVVVMLIMAVAVPTIVALASMGLTALRRDGPPILTGPAARLVVDVVALALLVNGQPSDAAGHRALADLFSGGARLLSVSLPAPAAGPPLGVVIASLGLATGIATELARRSTHRLAPIVPGVLLLIAALLVGSGGATPAGWAGPLVLAACGVSVAVSGLRVDASRRTRSSPSLPGPSAPSGAPLGRLAMAGVTVLIIAAVLVPAGSHLPGANARSPYVLRSAAAPPPQPLSQTDPLSGYANIHDGPVAPVFSVRAPGSNLSGQYWRSTVLNGFNGAEWTPTSVFRPAGSQLPPGPRLTVPSTRVHAQVTVYGPVSYLPAPNRPTSTSLPLVDVDQATGVLAPDGGLATPIAYQVTSQIPNPSLAALLDSAIPVGDANAGSPPPPTFLASLAQELVRSAQPTPWDRVLKLASYLTGSPFTLQPPGHSLIGSSYHQVEQLINTHTGSAEQYAAAFAILARAVGFHTRLAIGYVHTSARATSAVTYTTADYTVWPEVLLNGIGWEPIPVDPATGTGTGGSSAPASNPVASAIARQNQIDHARPPAGPSSNHGPPGIVRTATPASGVPVAVIVLLAVLAALAATLLAVLGGKFVRSRRQRRALDPGRRLAGAWEHALDRLSEFGVPLTGALTAGEVADRAITRLGTDRAAPATGLVPIVDAARYDRRFPPTRAAADAAWVAAGHLDTALRAGTPVLRRVRARLSVAPLRRR